MTRELAPLTSREIERLRRIRLDEGWSYEELAVHIFKRSGVASTLRRILDGGAKKVIRETTLFRVREFLGSYQPKATTESVGAR